MKFSNNKVTDFIVIPFIQTLTENIGTFAQINIAIWLSIKTKQKPQSAGYLRESCESKDQQTKVMIWKNKSYDMKKQKQNKKAKAIWESCESKRPANKSYDMKKQKQKTKTN